MANRPQPYRTTWPLSPSQVEGIDEMFGILFKAVKTPVSRSSVTAVVEVSVRDGVDGRDGEDADSWPAGSQNLQGFVPYLGASTDVDLGAKNLSTTGSLLATTAVGVNTASPQGRFHVTGTAGEFAIFERNSAAGGLNFIDVYNSNLTDQNDAYIQWVANQTTTSGFAASSGFARIGAVFVSHTNGARTGDLVLRTVQAGTEAERFRLTTAGILTVTGLATTSTDGLVATNTTAATGGATVQISPRTRWRGNAWDTAASQTVDMFAECLPVSLATPRGIWRIGFSLNGAAATYPFVFGSGGDFTTLGQIEVPATSYYDWAGRTVLRSPANGNTSLSNNAESIGVRLKHDALPTVNSGFGVGAAVTAGSTPLAGSINVGTGGVALTGVIDFNGTAFPSAPFVVVMNDSTAALVRATASTTQLTITAPLAFVASDIISWICIGARA